MAKVGNRVRVQTYLFTKPGSNMDGKEVFFARSIPLATSVKLPKNSIVTLFGFRDAREALRIAAEKAVKESLSIEYIEMTAVVHNPTVTSVDEEKVKGTRLLNLTTAKKKYVDALAAEFHSRHRRKEPLFDPEQGKAVTRRLDDIEKLFDWPQFEHINMIVVNVPAGKNSDIVHPVALVRYREVIESAEVRGRPEIKVFMPNFMETKPENLSEKF